MSTFIRPLPSPPSSAAVQAVTPSDCGISFSWSSTSNTSVTNQSFLVRFPIGIEFPKASGAPRMLKARRREGRIFTHSPSSSVSSRDSSSSFGSILKADFFTPPSTPTEISEQTVQLASSETKIMPPVTPTPKKTRSKPANIIIPHTTPTAVVSSPIPSTVVTPITAAPSTVTASTPREVLGTSPLQTPLSPLSPNRRINTPNARIRKIAKLQRTLGENVPLELVFPTSKPDSTSLPSILPFRPAPKPTKRAKLLTGESVIQRVLPKRSRSPPCPPKSPEWPLTPTPDCTLNVDVHNRTAVGLHYALGLNSLPTRTAPAPAPLHAALVVPKSPPPFSNTFKVDDVSWERARQDAMEATRSTGRKAKRVLGGVRKAEAVEANGRGTWRKKENTWSGEWNVEDMEELQVRLRRLRRI
ncbi:hypothetical protein R3P38DRAFT_3320259 [Favolaschia claudopus]|uniref:Uncharacterized protein n=1 Tax=Favolaschia claudopus TaxID=2862362 RepID=A0AAW0B065_9AGAR